MLKYVIYLVLCSSFLLASCMGEKAQFTSEGANYFGEEISFENTKLATGIKQSVEPGDTLDIVLEGTIKEVCQAKGCWMTFASAGNPEEVFIRFKDYGFFVPKNAGGKKAVVKGKLFANITSVDELRHYAEDKGLPKEEIAAITEPKSEIRMMADGVIIYND